MMVNPALALTHLITEREAVERGLLPERGAPTRGAVESPRGYEPLPEGRNVVPAMGGATKGPRIWTARELLETVWPARRFLVDGLLPIGLALLAGRPKVGKSWLALQLAVAVATGGRFLGHKVDAGDALYLCLEDSPQRMAGRLATMQAPGCDTLRLSNDLVPLGTPGALAQLKSQLRDDTRLVVIDTLSRGTGGKVDWDNQGAVTAILGPLQSMAQDRALTVLVIDHHRKPGALNPDVIDDVSGSTAKTGVADSILGLFRVRGQHAATLQIRSRELEETALAVAFDRVTCCWQCEADGVKPDTVQDRIRTVLANLGEATTAGLAVILDMPPSNVSRELAELADKGVIVKGQRRKDGIPYLLSRDNDDTKDKDGNGDRNDNASRQGTLSLSVLSHDARVDADLAGTLGNVDSEPADGLAEGLAQWRKVV